MTSEPAADLRRHSARVRRSVTVLWSACLVLVVLERFSAATIRLFADGFSGEALRHLACEAAAAVPEGLFLLALWWVREALAAFARGEWFGAPMTRMLNRVGIVLACGSAMRILIVPGICRLLGFSEGHWIAFDAAGMVLGAIGLAFQAIAGVLRRAAAIQSELDELF